MSTIRRGLDIYAYLFAHNEAWFTRALAQIQTW